MFERGNCVTEWHTAHESVYLLAAGGADGEAADGTEKKLFVKPNTLVSVFPVAGSVGGNVGGRWQVESAGLKWPLGGLDWEASSSFGISNVALSNEITFKVKHGKFLVLTEY